MQLLVVLSFDIEDVEWSAADIMRGLRSSAIAQSAAAVRLVKDPIASELTAALDANPTAQSAGDLFRGECADTHAQPRPFSPEVSTKTEPATIALEQRKENPNVR